MTHVKAVQTVATTGLEPETVPTQRRPDIHRTANFGRTLKNVRLQPPLVNTYGGEERERRSKKLLGLFTAPTSSTQPFPQTDENLVRGESAQKSVLKQVSEVTVPVRKAQISSILAKRLSNAITREAENVLQKNADRHVRSVDVDGATLAEAAGYYPSAFGLLSDRRIDASKPRMQFIDHIITRPVELMALASKFHFDGNIIWPEGVIASVPYKDPEWNWTPSPYQKMAILGEQASTFIVKLKLRADKMVEEADKPKAKAMMRAVRKYARQKKILSFIRATFDALMLSYQLLIEKGFSRNKLTSTQNRGLRRFRQRLVMSPFQAASELKALAGECRAWYFENGPQPKHPLVSGFTREEARLFSLIGRSLPATSNDPNDGQMEGLFERLTDDPKDVPEDWSEFVKIYLETFKPKEDEEDGQPKINWSMLPSNHSSLGYSRAMGGFNEAVKDLAIVGLAVHFTDKVPLPPLPEGHKPTVTKNRASIDDEMLKAEPVPGFVRRAELSMVMSQALDLGVCHTLDRFERIPTLPISAPERGLKTRFPTLELAAANCLHQLFRRVADAHFQRDPRCSADMGGSLVPPAYEAKDGPFYSVDASFATDKHMFGLTQELYLQLVDLYPTQLGKYRKYIPLIMGSRSLLTVSMDSIPKAPRPPNLDSIEASTMRGKTRIKKKVPLFGYPSWLRQSGPVSSFFGKWASEGDGGISTSAPVRDAIKAYRKLYDEWLDGLKTLPHEVTTTGAMMGSATSFPVMPLITFYGIWVAGGKPDNLRHYNQSCKATGDDAEVPCGRGRVSRSIWLELEQSGEAYSPSNHEIAAQKKSLVFQDAIVRCGVTISKGDPAKNKPRKDYYHNTKSIFKEVFFDGGVRLDSTPTSLWVAPPGGSKAQVNWFTQGTAIRQSLTENERPAKTRLWSRSPLRREVEAAYRLGMPVREPVAFGGVLYNNFPHRAPGQTDQWLHKVNNLTIKEITTGTGLSPLPAPDPSRVRQAASAWFSALLETEKERLVKQQYNPEFGIERPHIKDVIEAVAATSANANLYWAPTVKSLDRPSIARASFAFARTIRPKSDAYRKYANPDKTQGYANVRTGYEGKKDRYYDGTFEDLGMETPARPYSLIPMLPSRRLERLVRPHGDLIVQLAEDPWRG